MMQSKEWLIFRILTDKFHKGTGEALLKNIPQEVREEVLKQPLESSDISLFLDQPETLIEKVHYSWLLDAFKTIPEAIQPSILAALSDDQAKGIAKAFSLPFKKIHLKPIFKRFLINALYTRFEKKDILPIEFLPENPITCLTTFSKQRLVSIINYLGIYDLSEEVRHIVEKKLLTSIYAAIPLKKQQFLKQCLSQKEKIVTPRLNLSSWNKTERGLEKILHKRGMIRLSHALSGKHPDFLWHVIHRLDSGRGQVIAAHYKPQESSAVSNALTAQVINVINFLNKKSKL